MRKFENIKSLHLEPSETLVVPKFQYASGAFTQLGSPNFSTGPRTLPPGAVLNSDRKTYTLEGKIYNVEDGTEVQQTQVNPIETIQKEVPTVIDPINKVVTNKGIVPPPTTEDVAQRTTALQNDPSKAAKTIVDGQTFSERQAQRQARRQERSEAIKERAASDDGVSFGTKAKTTLRNAGSYAAGTYDAVKTGLAKAAPTVGAVSQVGSQIAGAINPGPQTDLDSDKDINAGMDIAANVASTMGPYGQLASFAIKGIQAAGNFLAGQAKPKFEVDKDLQARQGASYVDTFKRVEKLSQGPGIRGIFGSGEWRNKWEDAKASYELTKGIDKQNEDRQAAGRWEGLGLQNEMALNGGYKSLRAAKNGMKISNLKFAHAIKLQYGSKLPIVKLNAYKNPESQTFDFSSIASKLSDLKFGNIVDPNNLFTNTVNELHSAPKKKEGGIIEFTETGFIVRPKYKEGGSFNVIPDGALHKNKHHMEDAEGLTKKGIPVVTVEDGKKVQQAEIELNEIIFRLEVTEKLEKLAKEGTEEAAIEAGKLLVQEILHNTHDNTGLLKDIK